MKPKPLQQRPVTTPLATGRHGDHPKVGHRPTVSNVVTRCTTLDETKEYPIVVSSLCYTDVWSGSSTTCRVCDVYD